MYLVSEDPPNTFTARHCYHGDKGNSSKTNKNKTKHTYIVQSGFSLSFKVDSEDVNVGGLPIEFCRQFQAFTLSLYPFSPKSRRLKPPSSRFFSQLPALNENPEYSIKKMQKSLFITILTTNM